MTNEDAIKWLENLKNDIGNPQYECLWHYAQAIDEICALLKEREAIRPKRIMGTSICDCGRCKHAVAPGMDYCPVCGCRIDWN